MMPGAVGNHHSTVHALDDHGTTRYDARTDDSSIARRSVVTSWPGVAAVVVVAVWWSDVVVDPATGIDRGRIVVTAVIVVLALVVAFATPVGSIGASVSSFRRFGPVLVIALATIGCGRGIVEWSVQGRSVSGTVHQVMRVVEDPKPRGRAVRVVVDDGRDRLEAFTYGSSARRLSQVSAGQLIAVEGTRRSVDPSVERRLLLRHVTGRLDVRSVQVRPIGVERAGRGLDRAANRIRGSLYRGARVLENGDRALLLGLLVGDDRAQDRETIRAFRSSGLAHLTAVSGQNVAFVLAIVSPLLARLPRGPRLAATLFVLVWFAVLTRAEPSVIRAVLMAAIAAVGTAFEWRRRGLDVLAVAVVIGVLVDPFLVWSIGWWLSVGGCIGLAVVAPRVHAALGGGRFAGVISPTLGAQLGVLPVQAVIFGWPSAWSVPCNVLAGPIAGSTMLLGLPMTLGAAHLPDPLATVVMAPIAAMVRWVDLVARVGAGARLPRWIDVMVAVIGPIVVIGLHRRHVRVASSGHERSPGPRLR